jgi:hypothetical protein
MMKESRGTASNLVSLSGETGDVTGAPDPWGS